MQELLQVTAPEPDWEKLGPVLDQVQSLQQKQAELTEQLEQANSENKCLSSQLAKLTPSASVGVLDSLDRL